MKDEIRVGEFVRNKEGKIIKATWVGQAIVTNDKFTMSKLSGEIVKHSFNIIDLIQVGDYVNGYYCKRIPNFANKICNFDLNTMEWTPLENIDIWHNILTKEQMEANQYVVE